MLKPAASPYLFFYSLIVIVGIGIFIALNFYTQFNKLANYFIAINCAVLLIFAYDKMIAGKKNTRVPEIVLYTIAVIGGSIGLLLGMRLFRHKTRKGSFQIVLTLIVLIQTWLVAYYFLY